MMKSETGNEIKIPNMFLSEGVAYSSVENNVVESLTKRKVNIFIRLLFRAFNKSILYLAYDEPRKYPKKFEGMEFVFRDLNGLEYYKHKEDTSIDILRRLYITDAYVQLVSGFGEAEVNKSLLAIHEAINERDEKDKMKPNIAKVSAICMHLLNRSGRLINEEALYSLAAHYFVRSDEDLGIIDEKIHSQKVTVLKNEFKEGVKVWFFGKSLDKLFPFLKNDESMFDDLLKESEIQAKAYAETLISKHNGTT